MVSRDDEQQLVIQYPSVTVAARLTTVEQHVFQSLSVDVSNIQERMCDQDARIQSIVDPVHSG